MTDLVKQMVLFRPTFLLQVNVNGEWKTGNRYSNLDSASVAQEDADKLIASGVVEEVRILESFFNSRTGQDAYRLKFSSAPLDTSPLTPPNSAVKNDLFVQASNNENEAPLSPPGECEDSTRNSKAQEGSDKADPEAFGNDEEDIPSDAVPAVKSRKMPALRFAIAAGLMAVVASGGGLWWTLNPPAPSEKSTSIEQPLNTPVVINIEQHQSVEKLPEHTPDFQAGLNAYNRGDYETALREWLPLADQGLAEAQIILGIMYAKGKGVPQDEGEAEKWYGKAADQGYGYAKITPTTAKPDVDKSTKPIQDVIVQEKALPIPDVHIKPQTIELSQKQHRPTVLYPLEPLPAPIPSANGVSSEELSPKPIGDSPSNRSSELILPGDGSSFVKDMLGIQDGNLKTSRQDKPIDNSLGLNIPPILSDSDHAQPANSRIVIFVENRRLRYYVGNALLYDFPVGVGKVYSTIPFGKMRVIEKRENPSWYPPAEIRKIHPNLPSYVPPGKDNPLGHYALYLDRGLYRIHGTNKPDSVGERSTAGCFRLADNDIKTLFGAISVGAEVEVVPSSAPDLNKRIDS